MTNVKYGITKCKYLTCHATCDYRLQFCGLNRMNSLIKIHKSLNQDEQGIMKTNFNHNRHTGCCLKEDRRCMAEIHVLLIRRKTLSNRSINQAKEDCLTSTRVSFTLLNI